MSRDDDAMAGCLLAVAFLGPLAVFRAWTAMLLWGWFVVPLGVADISMGHAYGLLLLLALATQEYDRPDDGTKVQAAVSRIVQSFMLTATALGIGWWLS